MQGKKESTRVQIRKDGKKIADITIPYAWKESDWPDSLMRIKAAAKAYEESGQKLDLKTCFNIAHTVSSETENDWKGDLAAYSSSKFALIFFSTSEVNAYIESRSGLIRFKNSSFTSGRISRSTLPTVNS